MTFEVEVIFKDSSGIKTIENVQAVYTKGLLLCIQVDRSAQGKRNMIIKYPVMNIFSICHEHGDHWGSRKNLAGK